MEKKHIIRTLENTPVDIGDTLYQVIDCETPYIREITVTGFRCEPDGVAMMCRAENSGRDVRLDVERWGADVFESKADAERGLAGLKARRDAAPEGFDAVLMERPFDGAIDHRDVVRMLALLDSDDFQMLTVDAKSHESFAMGFIAKSALRALSCDPQGEGLCDFVAGILDDMRLENPDNAYSHRGLRICVMR